MASMEAPNEPIALTPSTTQSEDTGRTETPKIANYRRNGKLYSCEPVCLPCRYDQPRDRTNATQCRQNKLRCDHATPVCGRCAKRGKRSLCIYHPAPLTKPNMVRAKRASSKRAPFSPPALGSSTKSSSVFKGGRKSFLGPTSFSAIFTENDQSLEMVDDAELPIVVEESIEQSVRVLSVLAETLPLSKHFMSRRYDIYRGLIPTQIYKMWTDGVPMIDDRADRVRTTCWSIWQNTVRPIRISADMSIIEWAEQSSGANLRWDVIGLILTMSAITAHEIGDWDAIFEDHPETHVERAEFILRTRNAAEFCLSFCFQCEALNEIYAMFLLKSIALVEMLQGDTRYAGWQKSGELCDAIVAMGMHRQKNRSSTNSPFWLLELRKKLFLSCYTRDKLIAVLFGRPPRLCYKYCQVEAPLDLSNETLLLQGAELQKALILLTPEGWNTTGEVHSVTRARVWFQLCRIREDILELALGTDDNANVSTLTTRIRHNLDDFQKSFLVHIPSTPEELFRHDATSVIYSTTNTPGRRNAEAITCLFIYGSVIHTEFLLTRALINRHCRDYKELVPISQKLLDLVLLGVSRSDMYKEMRCEYTFLLLTLGLPSAGVLAIELLKQQQQTHHDTALLPRSETIQNLSVFVAALASIEPRQGNYSVCSQGRRVMRRLLDQILNSPKVVDNGHLPLFDDMSFSFPVENDVDFLEWLDNTEWPVQDI